VAVSCGPESSKVRRPESGSSTSRNVVPSLGSVLIGGGRAVNICQDDGG
jgi:hypothetical protein